MESDKNHNLKTDLILVKFITVRMKIHMESSNGSKGRMITSHHS